MRNRLRRALLALTVACSSTCARAAWAERVHLVYSGPPPSASGCPRDDEAFLTLRANLPDGIGDGTNAADETRAPREAAAITSAMPSTVSANDLPPAPSRKRAAAIGGSAPSATSRALAERAAPVTRAPSELGAEVNVLSTAKELLDAHNTAGAQAAIERYARDFPAGAFTAEALALEIDVASADGRSADVARLGDQFLAAYPQSPHVARVRAAMTHAAKLP